MNELKIAHRGLHNTLVPENSLGAFKEAIKNNYMIELDIHLTKDNKIVVFHDDNLKRMTNIDKKICECTYEELKTIKLLDTKYTIPLLSEVLNLVNGKVPILIEIKYDQKIGLLEHELMKILDNYNGNIYLQSFRIRTYLWFKLRKYPYKNGLLIKKRKHSICYLYIFLILKIFKSDFISVSFNILNNKYIKKISNNTLLFVWTIKNENKYKKVKNSVDGIIFENCHLV